MSAGLLMVTEYRTEHIPESRVPMPGTTRHRQMFHDGRERRESEGGRIVVIIQPDLRREVWLETETRTFTVQPMFELATAEETRKWQKSSRRYTQQHLPFEQKHEITIHTQRHEETAEFFGVIAERHTMHTTYVYPAGVQQENESISDGWYIKVEHPAIKASWSRRAGLVYVSQYDELPMIRRTGDPEHSGLPAKVAITTWQRYTGSGGLREYISKQFIEIVHLSECSLEPALFEIPEGFRERSVSPGFWDPARRLLQEALRRIHTAR